MLAALRDATPPESAWHAALQVSVADDSLVTRGISGRYALNDSSLEFRPRFAFDAGRRYRVTFDARQLAPIRSDTSQLPSVMTFSLPAGNRTPSTHVTAVLPGSDSLPENLLRLYIEFSAPMARSGGIDHVQLLDERDRVVTAAFLPLDADFWNRDGTRFTVFLDPGRVKRGILPNEQLGRAIRAGHRYSIVVDSTWLDARGLPLTAPYRRTFQVMAPDERIIDIKAWSITPPPHDTKQALTVVFPRPLDHGLLMRAIGVEHASGEQVFGEVTIAQHETVWRFTPRDAWRRGPYQLLVLSILEDAAGNRIDGPFEVDMFERVDTASAPVRRLIPFRVP